MKLTPFRCLLLDVQRSAELATPAARHLLLAVAALLCANGVRGQQIPDAVFTVRATAGQAVGGAASDIRTGATPRNVAVDHDVEFVDPREGYSLTQSAHAETYGLNYPHQAVATAEARVTSCAVADAVYYCSAAAEASAFVQYYVHVAPTNDAGLVWRPTVIPMQFHAAAAVTGAGSASVGLQLNLTSLFFDTVNGTQYGDTRNSFDRTAAFSVAPGSYLRASLSANVIAYDFLGGTGFEPFPSSQAVTDPTLTFDQAAFDIYAAQQGRATFNLADFYSFEYSPGVVPEPGSGSLLVVGLLLLALHTRRRFDRVTASCSPAGGMRAQPRTAHETGA